MAFEEKPKKIKENMAKYGYVDVKSKKLKIFKKRWLVLYRSISSQTASILKYKDEDHYKNNKHRAVYLVSTFMSVERLPEEEKKYTVVIHLKEDDAGLTSVIFSCCSDTEADDWVDSIRKEMYSLSSSNDEFPVYLVPNDLLSTRGEMLMRVRERWVSLLDSNKRITSEWELNKIRRYKEEDPNTFWIEIGRTSETGEGRLVFTTTYAHKILEKIHNEAINLTHMSIWSSSETSNLCLPVFPDQGPMLRPVNNPILHHRFLSETDLSEMGKSFEPTVGWQKHNASSVKHGHMNGQRDSGYIESGSFLVEKSKKIGRSQTLPAPPPVQDDCMSNERPQGQLMQRRLEWIQSLHSERKPSQSSQLEDISETDRYFKLEEDEDVKGHSSQDLSTENEDEMFEIMDSEIPALPKRKLKSDDDDLSD